MFVLTFQECSVRYGLNAEELRSFLAFGLLRPAPTPDAVEVDDEPDDILPRLARLHHGLGVPPEARTISSRPGPSVGAVNNWQ